MREKLKKRKIAVSNPRGEKGKKCRRAKAEGGSPEEEIKKKRKISIHNLIIVGRIEYYDMKTKERKSRKRSRKERQKSEKKERFRGGGGGEGGGRYGTAGGEGDLEASNAIEGILAREARHAGRPEGAATLG